MCSLDLGSTPHSPSKQSLRRSMYVYSATVKKSSICHSKKIGKKLKFTYIWKCTFALGNKKKTGHMYILWSVKIFSLIKILEFLICFKMHTKQEAQGPQIVHLCTICHLFDGSARAAIFVYWSAKNPPHKLGSGHSDLASSQVSLNSIQRFQRRSGQCKAKSRKY